MSFGYTNKRGQMKTEKKIKRKNVQRDVEAYETKWETRNKKKCITMKKNTSIKRTKKNQDIEIEICENKLQRTHTQNKIISHIYYIESCKTKKHQPSKEGKTCTVIS